MFRSKRSVREQRVLGVVVLLVVVATGAGALSSRRAVADRQERELSEEFDRRADAALIAVRERVADYERSLSVVAGFIGAVPEVSPEVWHDFVGRTGILRANEKSAVGYAEIVEPRDLPAFVARETRLRSDAPVVLAEPRRMAGTDPLYFMTLSATYGQSHPASGEIIDAGSLALMREAFARARATGTLQTLSTAEVVLLLREQIEAVRGTGVLVEPVERFIRDLPEGGRSGASLIVPVVRRSDGVTVGFVLAAVLPDTQVSSIDAGLGGDIRIRLEADIGSSWVDGPASIAASGVHRRTIEGRIGGIRWRAEAVATETFEARNDSMVPAMAVVLVSLVGLLLASILVLRHRLGTRADRALRRLAGAEDRAGRDPLTGLRNRVGLDEAVASIRADHDSGAAVIFIDLDGLKVVNDALGHRAGDELLRTAAQRLRIAVRTEDIVARLGGDEFVVVVPGVGAAGIADRIAASIHSAFADPVASLDLAGGGVVAASLGVAYAASMFDVNDAISRADAAMYRAKSAGGNQVAFEDQAELLGGSRPVSARRG